MTRNLTHPRRLKVLHLARDAGYGGIGGAEILVLEFARRLDPERFESFLCTTRRPEADRTALAARETADLERSGVRVLNLDRPSSASLAPWGRLWWVLVRERIDVVHTHMPRANVPGALLARAARVPVVVAHEHGSVRYADPVRRLLNRTVVGPLTDAVLAVSEWDRQRLVSEQGLPESRVRVFRNGILPLPDDLPDLRPELAEPGTPIVGALGRLDPVKGYDTLIDAVARLRADGVRLRCVIAGVGPDEARLRSLIHERRVGDDVALLGLREDVPALLRAFDVAVMSSRSEGAPLAIIEYMAAGVPIVATGVGGIPELIEPEVHGILVEPDDAEALAGGIRRVLEHPDRAAELAVAARARQQAEFDLDVVVRRLEELYLSLYASRRARGRGGRPAHTAVRSG